MIGFYDYTVILTYVSLACSVFGIMQAMGGNCTVAILCLALSGLMDMFDGKIARTKKDRSNDEKLFGVQIDSLCDVICFGILPSVISFVIVGNSIIFDIIIVYYCICSVIRLAFFNVLETNRQRIEGGANKFYHGLPITTISILLPIAFFLKVIMSDRVFDIVLMVLLFAVGSLFIINFQIKKPSNVQLCILVTITGCVVIAFLLCNYYHILDFSSVFNKSVTSVFKRGACNP